MSSKKYLIIVGGPTASGKTTLAIKLAQYFNTEIISCDSRQFFKELKIGTARPTPEELEAAPHHFVAHLSIFQKYTVGDFEQEALQLLEQLYEKHQHIVLVGGSGLYIKALCEGLDQFPEVDVAIRAQWNQVFEEEGLAPLQEALKEYDPDYYKEVDLQNPKRLIRALSVYTASGQPFSSFRKHKKAERFFIPIYLYLDWERSALYERINQRVELMLQEGLEEEARQLFPNRQLNALQTVGYQELFDYLEGKHSLEDAVELIKRNTRRYAKRQLTWLRKEAYWQALIPGDVDGAIQYVLQKSV